MGELAVGERRGSWDRPGRSAVLGLVAACLGLDRADEDAHLALETGFGLGLRVEWRGPTLADYQTAQVPPTQRGRRFTTRAEELAAPDLDTILSRRDYRAGLQALGALWPRGQTRWTLGEIAAAMRKPFYVPYLGRKSCPLMLPLAPALIDAPDAVAALAARSHDQASLDLLLWPGGADRPVVTLDAADAGDHRVQRIEMRRDRPASRRRWQFALREEAVLE
jgi:CRISPR system Cascade subunit CasD